VRWIDPHLPAALLADDEVARRARAVVIASGVYLAINTLIGLVVIPALVPGRPEAVAAETMLGVLGGCCALVLRRTASVPLAANLLMALGVANIWSMSFLSGGADGAVMSCLILVPFVAYALTDARTGALWLAIVWASAVALSILADHAPGWPPRSERPALVDGLLIASLASGFYVVQAAYDRIYRDALARQARAKREAEAANRAKSAFLAAMSHELRTPMNGVLGVADLLLREPLSPDSREMVGVIRSSSEALLGIIDQILDLAKVEAGHFDLERLPFDVGALLREVRTLVELAARKKGLAVELVGEGHLGAKHRVGDALRVRQILLNLLGNAVKFTAAGRVAIEVLPDGARGGLAIDVVDTGIGIAPDALARLFKPFSQADASTTRRFGGTGLGLAISQQLAEAMGGTLEVSSTLGVGSRFHLWLPLAAAPEAAAEAQANEPEAPPAPTSAPEVASAAPSTALPARVLVVEDNVVNQQVVRRLLARLGVEVELASDGAEALEKLTSIDLVLMDCHMPGMDGLEASRRIRALPPPLGRLPIIALSAAVFEEEQAATREAGMDAFLAKPIRLDALEAALREAWRRHASVQPRRRADAQPKSTPAAP
jgi:signal transduction histidine kinase/AmiR/NasT family two-component response regulator